MVSITLYRVRKGYDMESRKLALASSRQFRGFYSFARVPHGGEHRRGAGMMKKSDRLLSFPLYCRSQMRRDRENSGDHRQNKAARERCLPGMSQSAIDKRMSKWGGEGMNGNGWSIDRRNSGNSRVRVRIGHMFAQFLFFATLRLHLWRNMLQQPRIIVESELFAITSSFWMNQY